MYARALIDHRLDFALAEYMPIRSKVWEHADRSKYRDKSVGVSSTCIQIITVLLH